MNDIDIRHCLGTLAPGYQTYSQTCLRRLFNNRKVHHVLPYDAPESDENDDVLFLENRKRNSISGVQEKFSLVLEKNKLRLIALDEHGQYILKPIPGFGKNRDQMPANEHLTMQIARQVFDIETAENALIYFKNGAPAYITKRFDVNALGSKLAKEDFASLAGRTPQVHGENYKYLGSYLDLFVLLKKFTPAYKIEAPKLLKRIIFNYLFSNGDAHYKNFSLLETKLGDFRLSPAYDLLNTRIHIQDADFALDEGLLPNSIIKRKVFHQLKTLAEHADISEKQSSSIFETMLSGSEQVSTLIQASYLDDKFKRNYLQAYQTRLNRLNKI